MTKPKKIKAKKESIKVSKAYPGKGNVEQEILKIDPQKLLQIAQQESQLVHQQSFSGPLPSPVILKEYNEILPDAAERIFQMAEKSRNHYEETSKKIVESEVKKVQKGQNHAFMVALAGITGAVVCAFIEQVTIGAIIGGSTLVSLVPHLSLAFVRKKTMKMKVPKRRFPNFQGKRLIKT